MRREDDGEERAGTGLPERFRFLSLATDISRLLLSAHPDSLDARVDDALARIGEVYEVDRITLRWLDEEGTALQRTNQWMRSSDRSLPEILRVADLPYLWERIRRRELVAVRRLDEVPEEGKAEIEMLRSLGTRSALLIPLVVGGALVGACIVTTEREERDWSDATMAELWVLGELMASATSRCRAERALQETEERFRALSEGGLFCVWLHDFEGRFLHANPAALRLLGYTRDEIGSLSFTSLLDEDQLVKSYRCLQGVLETGSAKEPLSLTLRTKNGELVWVEADAHLLYRSGKPHAIQGIARDVTRQRRAEEALRQRERRFRDIAENAAEWIWEVDANGKYTYASSAIEETLGYTPEEALQKHFFDFFHPDDREESKKAALEVFARKEPFRGFENRNLHKDGHPVWLSTSGVPILDDRGNLLGYRGADADITARKRMEGMLRESEARYRLLAENATDIMWAMDLNLAPSYVSPSVTRMRGFSVEEALSQTIEESMTPASAELARRVLAEELLIESREQKDLSRSRTVEVEMKCKDGSTAWTEVNMSLLRDEAGKAVGILGISRDISERMRAQEALSRHMAHQSLLAELSAGLLRARPDELDEQIELALERICGVYSFLGTSLWWFDDARECARRSHTWYTRIPAPEEIRVSDAPWLARRVLEGEITKVQRLAELPAEAAADRDLLASMSTEAILLVPLRVERDLVGFATFDHDREGGWPDEIVEELQLLAELLANAFARSQAMKSVKQRERDLVRAQQVGHVGSYVAYPASGRVELSDELCAIVGRAPGEISHDLGISFVHPEDRERVHATRQQARTGAVPPEVEYRVRRSDGSIRHVHDRWEIERDSRGEPVKMLGTVVDITAHKGSEAALAEALAEVTRLKERIEAENVYLREEVRLAHGFDEIVGESPELMECLRLVQRVAPTDSTVLILGETGTGKELIARAIHAWSPRREGPLVSVNCAALPETLIESELFGHERGAFTGALERRRGRFELASGGTLFLDEIGDLPLHLQAKLLRVLQEGEIERVGGSAVIPVDVRVIASTHRNLEHAVEREDFRADLYFRISGFPIFVPPLRERASDIPLLANHFAQKHGKRLSREIDSISTRMLRHLMAYPWPGNVRELENLVQRTLITSSGPVLDLAEPLRSVGTPQSAAPGANPASLREAERDHILRLLGRTRWVIEGPHGAAALLGIPASTLRSKMKKLGIERRV